MSFLSHRWISRLAITAGLSFVCSAAPAQSGTPGGRVLHGRVVKHGEPVAGAQVTLHRVTSSESGPVSQQRSAPDGSFRFQLPPGDTAGFTVFFTTAEYRAVRYFGAPLHQGEPPAGYTVEVYDTTSSLPDSVVLARRDAVLVPGNDGGWEVNEIVRVRNVAGRTLVPRDGIRSWELRLPASAQDFEAGEGEVSPAQIRLVGDRVLLLSPLVPGEHEIFFRYTLPAGTDSAAFPLAGPVDTLNLYVRQPAPRVSVHGLAETRSVTVQGERFIQYGATGLPAASRVSLEFDDADGPPVSPVTAGVGAAVLLLLLGSWAALRQRAEPAGRPGASVG